MAAAVAVVMSWGVQRLAAACGAGVTAFLVWLEPADKGLFQLASTIFALVLVLGTEACKLAVLYWICSRDWSRWARLGLAFGSLKVLGLFAMSIYNAIRFAGWRSNGFPSTMTRSEAIQVDLASALANAPDIMVMAGTVLLTHMALGRLAAVNFAASGSVARAFALACVAAVLIVLFYKGLYRLLALGLYWKLYLIDFDRVLTLLASAIVYKLSAYPVPRFRWPALENLWAHRR